MTPALESEICQAVMLTLELSRLGAVTIATPGATAIYRFDPVLLQPIPNG
jgi:hypothetical protein